MMERMNAGLSWRLTILLDLMVLSPLLLCFRIAEFLLQKSMLRRRFCVFVHGPSLTCPGFMLESNSSYYHSSQDMCPE